MNYAVKGAAGSSVVRVCMGLCHYVCWVVAWAACVIIIVFICANAVCICMWYFILYSLVSAARLLACYPCLCVRRPVQVIQNMKNNK